MIKRKAGRPSASRRTVTNEEALTTQSKARTYDKKLCIIFKGLRNRQINVVSVQKISDKGYLEGLIALVLL